MRYLILSDMHANWEAFEAVLRRARRKRFDAVAGARRPGGLRRRAQPGGRGGARAARRGLAGARQPRQGGDRDRHRRRLQPGRARRRAVDRRPADARQPALRRASCRRARSRWRRASPSATARRSTRTPTSSPTSTPTRSSRRTRRRSPSSATPTSPRSSPSSGAAIGVRALRGDGRADRARPGAALPVNPGSIGQPRDRDPRAAFMTYDSERRWCAGTGWPTRSPAPRPASAPPACPRRWPTGWRWGRRREQASCSPSAA